MDDTPVLSGTYEAGLDAKGRVALPVRCRLLLCGERGGCVVTRSLFDPCLWLYAETAWQRVMTALQGLPSLTDPLHRSVKRMLLGSASLCQPDQQGRILIPPTLRASGDLMKKCRFVGMGDKLELWSDERYRQQAETDEQLLRQAVTQAADHPELDGLLV